MSSYLQDAIGEALKIYETVDLMALVLDLFLSIITALI